MPLRPCIVPRCPNYALPQLSRCEDHQREWEAGRWDRGDTGKRGSKQPGQATRRRVFQRAHGRCQRCGDRLIGNWEMHHVDHDATNNALDNLETRCIPCHRFEHRKVPKRQRPGSSGHR